MECQSVPNLPENSLPARLTRQLRMLHGSRPSSSHLPVSASDKHQAQFWVPAKLPGSPSHLASTTGHKSSMLKHCSQQPLIRAFVRTSDLEMQPFCTHVEELPMAHGFPLDPLGNLIPLLTLLSGIAVFDKHTVKSFTVLGLYGVCPRSLSNVVRSQVKFQYLKNT